MLNLADEPSDRRCWSGR